MMTAQRHSLVILALSGAALAASDDSNWAKKGNPAKDCNWVAEYTAGRCGFKHGTKGVKGEDGTYASEACAAACANKSPTKMPFYLSVPPLFSETPTTFGFFGTWKLADGASMADYEAVAQEINEYVVPKFGGTWAFTAAHDDAARTVTNVEMYASEAEFLAKMTDPGFLALAAKLGPVFGANRPETLVFGNVGNTAKQILDGSSNAKYLTSVDHSWLSKPGADTGAFVLALPFSYDPANMADFRKAADDMLAWATDNFDYPTYVIADDGAGTGIWLEVISTEGSFIEHQPDPEYVDTYLNPTAAFITGMRVLVLGDVSKDVTDFMATQSTAPITEYIPVVPEGLIYQWQEPRPGPITPGLSAVYEYAFESFEPKSVGTLTVYGALDGAKSKCEMVAQVTAEVSLSSTDVFSTTDLTPISPSPLFPGADKYMCPSMQWDRAKDELAYLVVPQGVTPAFELIADYTGSVWRDRGYTFKLVDDVDC